MWSEPCFKERQLIELEAGPSWEGSIMARAYHFLFLQTVSPSCRVG